MMKLRNSCSALKITKYYVEWFLLIWLFYSVMLRFWWFSQHNGLLHITLLWIPVITFISGTPCTLFSCCRYLVLSISFISISLQESVNIIIQLHFEIFIFFHFLEIEFKVRSPMLPPAYFLFLPLVLSWKYLFWWEL